MRFYDLIHVIIFFSFLVVCVRVRATPWLIKLLFNIIIVIVEMEKSLSTNSFPSSSLFLFFW